jgi:hypothetical protein
MDVTKPYEFIRFGAMDVTKPYKSMGFGAMDVTHKKNNIDMYIYIYIYIYKDRHRPVAGGRALAKPYEIYKVWGHGCHQTV